MFSTPIVVKLWQQNSSANSVDDCECGGDYIMCRLKMGIFKWANLKLMFNIMTLKYPKYSRKKQEKDEVAWAD